MKVLLHWVVPTGEATAQFASDIFSTHRKSCGRMSALLAICCMASLLLCIVAPLVHQTASAASKKALTPGKALRGALPDETRAEHSVGLIGTLPVVGIVFRPAITLYLSHLPSLLKGVFRALQSVPGRSPPAA